MSAQHLANRYLLSQSSGLAPITPSNTYNLTKVKLIEAIDQKSIAGIITIAPGSTEVTALFHPVCHRDAQGNVTHVIGNPSDKKGEFGLTKFDMNSYRSVLYVGEATTIPSSTTPGLIIEPDHLVGTKFEGMPNIAGATMTNIAVLPFRGMDPTGIDIQDNTQMDSIKTNSIYEWLSIVKSYIDNQDEIEAIVEKVISGDDEVNRTKYFDPFYTDPNATRLQLAVNGIHCTMTSASSDAFPNEVRELRTYYTSSLPSSAINSSASNATDSLVLALSKVIAPDEQGDKERARMGASVLALFAAMGTIDFGTKMITNLALSANSAGYAYVLTTSLKNQPDAFVQLYNKQFQNARKVDPMNVRSYGIKNTYLDKSTAAKILAGELSIHSLAEMKQQANPSDTIGAAFFLPTPATVPSNLAVAMQKQTYVKSMFARVAALTSLDDIKSLLVHITTFLGVLVGDVEKTILYQMTNKILILIHKPTFSDWFSKYGADFIYSALRAIEQILVQVAKYASDLHNVNAVMTAQPGVPITFDATHLESALLVLNTLDINVANAIANECVLPSQSGVALSYKAMAEQVLQDATPTIPPDSKPSASSLNDNSKQRKASVTFTQPQGDSRASNKKPKRTVVDTTSPRERKPATECGLFAPNSGVAKNKIMPPAIKINGKEVCMDFVCIGLLCSAPYGTCTRAHPSRPSDFTTDDIHKIAKHFIDNDIGKFNLAPFRTVTLPEELKSVISG